MANFDISVYYVSVVVVVFHTELTSRGIKPQFSDNVRYLIARQQGFSESY